MRALVRRICTAALAGVLFCVAVAIATELAGWSPGLLTSLVPSDHQLGLTVAPLQKRLVAAAVAFTLGVMAVILAICALPMVGDNRRWHLLYRSGSAGMRLKLANRAVRSIVAHAASTIDAVRGCEVEIGQHRRGWLVNARLVVEPTTVMPVAKDELTRVIEGALVHQTGLRVHRLQLRMELGDDLRARLK